MGGAIQRVQNKTSIYTGVTWNKNEKCWQVQLQKNNTIYYGGHFDNEDQAAMKVNILCDKYGIERKNPMINIHLDVIQQIQNQTSKYTGVYWNKGCKKWRVQLKHNKQLYFGGSFDDEDHAAMKVNLLCDKHEIERKNPEGSKDFVQKKAKSKTYQYETENIVNEQVKIEDENILNGFKNEWGGRLIQSNDQERCTATEFQNSNTKRKRKQNLILNDDVN